jgi:hypothetical protein
MKPRIDPKKRPVRSQIELQSDSKTLRYELDMLVGLAERFSSLSDKADRVARNAYIESFAVHCRALIFFLFGHLNEITANGKTERFARERSTDVLALDFYGGWNQDWPPPTELMVRAKRQADKHVAHITIDRREVNQPGSGTESVWELSQAASAICDAMVCFLQKAPAHNFDVNELHRMRDLIAEWNRWKSAAQMQPPPQSGSSRQPSPGTGLQAKTDARALPSQTRFDMHGKTQ